MPDILHEVTIEAPAEKVYTALTEEAGLRGWWTDRAKATPAQGSVAEFGFYGGQVVFKMKIEALESARHIKWDVEQGAPDGSWDGTHITWDLTAVENGTKVLLGHRAFASYNPNFANTNTNWGWFISSLKQYVETGKGMPAEV